MVALERAAVRPGTPVEELDTPALVVDLDRLEANLERWQRAATAHGARLRPHVKTHKVPAIALRQLELGACGIAAAKVSEAEVFADAGVGDVVVAYPVVGEAKWARLARLAARGVRVGVNCDSEVAARGLAAAAVERGTTLEVHLEVDSGFHRCGFPPEDTDSLERLARLVEELPGLELAGVTTHRGLGFDGAAATTPAQAGLDEGRTLVALAERLRARGLPVREVTAGSTPTGLGVARVAGITEVRAGTYVFNDLMQLGLGAAEPGDLALSILCTVTSAVRPGHATIDGGSKTFAADRGAAGALEGRGFARAAGRDAWLVRMSEEHGMLALGPGASVRVGEKIAFHPAHVCTCVNLAEELVGARAGRVEVVWPVAARGRRA